LVTRKGVKVFSHPRSGTHLMMHTLKRNFYPDVDLMVRGGSAGHWADRRQTNANPVAGLYGGHGRWNDRVGQCIYIYRDGRDVAVSMWLSKETMHPDWRNLPFPEWLSKPLDWHWSPGHRARRSFDHRPKRLTRIIANHWREHLDLWGNRSDICYVRYEQLVLDPLLVIRQIAQHFGLPFPSKPVIVKELVGLWPDGNPIGSWREHFTAEELRVFYQHVPKDFWGLWEE